MVGVEFIEPVTPARHEHARIRPYYDRYGRQSPFFDPQADFQPPISLTESAGRPHSESSATASLMKGINPLASH
ncbi:uncharacterized protein METZ01_LOCUS61243 [marine metagenome]|uniref:Uncharacterized protein n=1 Tax=marine metagenome TaxID=408172 RepID=A0A381SY63_9ZZZZ